MTKAPTLQPTTEKQTVAHTFGRAAAHYDAAAHLQRRVADALLDRLEVCDRPTKPVIADLGTGTGYCLPRLMQSWQPARLNALDLSPAMLERARDRQPEAVPIEGDLEALPFPEGSHHLLTTSLAVQWLDRPDAFLAEAWRTLAPGGLLAISTLTTGTLRELNDAWAAADDHRHVNDCLTESHWRDAVDRQRFERIVWDRECIEVGYDSPLDLLRELKQLGANRVKSGHHRLTREALNRMVQAYDRYRRPDGRYPASWQVLYVLLRKPSN